MLYRYPFLGKLSSTLIWYILILMINHSTSNLVIQTTLNSGNRTLYFAFGSNLLASRMHMMNPTAVRVGIGKLRDYDLDFASYSKRWHGYAATVIPEKGKIVWGALWEIPTHNLSNLDKQEGVQQKDYYPITVSMELPNGKKVWTRSYRQVQPIVHVDLQNLPEKRRPSPAYIETMVQGAEESGLPEYYINFLRKIPNNGVDAKPNLMEEDFTYGGVEWLNPTILSVLSLIVILFFV